MAGKALRVGLRVGLVVPHMFMHRDILPQVIFSPGTLALDLAAGLTEMGVEVTLFSPGPVDAPAGVRNVTADLSLFKAELAGRGDTYLDLLKKHPFTFITLARQVQAELIATAYHMANQGELDIVHIYTNEEETALPFAKLCRAPVVFTHHDPFNFLVKYKNVFPKYAGLNWLSMSYAQRAGMPADTNWVGNIYHGLPADALGPAPNPSDDYVAYFGRLIEPKGAHLAIAAVREYNRLHPDSPLPLRLAGKHYSGKKDTYWQTRIEPELDSMICYEGFIGDAAGKQAFLGNARAVIVPSLYEEPFGMVVIEALACGTPVIGLNSGALPELITNRKNGLLIEKGTSEGQTVGRLAKAISEASVLDRQACRQDFEARFSLKRMSREHLAVYNKLIKSPAAL